MSQPPNQPSTRSGFERLGALRISNDRPYTPLGQAARLGQWAAIGAASGAASRTVADWRQVAGGLCVFVAGIAFQWTNDDRQRVRVPAVVTTIVLGLVGMLLCPGGFAEIPVAVGASRLPTTVQRRSLPYVTGTVAVVFAIEVAWLSDSWTGLLAGMAIPFLVQRSLASHEVVLQRDRAEALLVEVQSGREAATQAAALQERGRIARDLHDVLAHSLAGLSVQLQAVRAIAARENVGPAVLEPLDKAALLAREGLAEARSVVSALRDPVGLGLGDLHTLVDRHPGNAKFVELASVEVTPEAGHAVYRAVQEALTNAARYAPGASVVVTVDAADGQLLVTVEDSGLPRDRSAVTGQGTGLGLAGMDERIRAAHGSVHAGPTGTGGWRVEIRIPEVSR